MIVTTTLNASRTTFLAAGFLLTTTAFAAAGSLGGPLELQDEGVFFVNGQSGRDRFSGFAADRTGGARPDHDRPDVCAIPDSEERRGTAH